MGASAVTSDYFSGQGVVLLSERDATTGEPLGFVNIGNVSSLAVTNGVTNFEHKESSTGQRGVDLRLTTETNVTATMVMESLNTTNLAKVLRGTRTAVTAGSVTDASYTSALGFIVPLAHIKVSSVVVTNVGATITYEVDKNYRVDEATGSIEFFTDAQQTALGAANNIPDATSVLVDYSYDAQYVVDAMTQGQKEYWLRFEGLNTASNNEPVVVDLFKYGIDPLAELGLINEQISQASVTGAVLFDATRSTGSKYYRVKSLDA